MASTQQNDSKISNRLIALERIGRNRFPGFIIDDVNREYYCKLLMWFSSDPEFELLERGFSLNKGLIINGAVGCGKTISMKLFQSNKRRPFLLTNTRVIQRRCIMEKGMDIINEYRKNPYVDYGPIPAICFDDFGTESSETSYMGNKFNLMAEILFERYERFISTGMITHITTNLSFAEIESIYGNKIVSRMKQMFNDVYLDGPDRRM